MRKNHPSLPLLGILILGMLGLSHALLGQTVAGPKQSGAVLTDWSNHHVIFSKPGTAERAKRAEQDPRYWQQLGRRSQRNLRDVKLTGDLSSRLRQGSDASFPRKRRKFARDWSQDLGNLATVGAGNYPAKFSLSGANANCAGTPPPDFVVYGTGPAATVGQASIVAYDNLYSGCSGTVPLVYWAYNTSGQVLTSPIFSRDGTQVAFTQTSAGAASLVLVKWAASTTESVASPALLTPVSAAMYASCPSPPCMATFALMDSGSPANDTHSSVFYDYSGDAAYVGDDSGWLHKFNPVFNGAPAEITVGWPLQVNPGTPTALTSPVKDNFSGNVFVADKGGFLYLVDSSATVTESGQLDFSNEFDSGPGITDGPIVDGPGELIYVFAPSDGSGGCPLGVGGTDCTAVYQLTTGFSAGDVGSEAVVGNSTVEPATPEPLFIGAFDSTYENSTDPPTGNLYVCGNTGGVPTVYQVPIVAGAIDGLGTALSGLSSGTTPCSPVTDIPNPNATGGTTEWIFASAQASGVSSGCAGGGCVFNLKVTPWQPSTSYALGQEVLDSHLQIQVVNVAGKSGALAPSWATLIGHTVHDHTVQWLDQGLLSAAAPAAWVKNNPYGRGSKILDPNNNVEWVASVADAGTSGSAIPTFNMTPDGTTSDGTVTWTNLGALGTAALPAAGGTSGIILDNVVGSGTQPGASQVYFSTLSNQVCTGGTGGCAVQASQTALK